MKLNRKLLRKMILQEMRGDSEGEMYRPGVTRPTATLDTEDWQGREIELPRGAEVYDSEELPYEFGEE